jgi:hypothetical protein
MTEPQPQPGFVYMIHPGLGAGSVSEVPESSVGQHYASGWVLLTAETAPPAEEPAKEPEPMTKAQAAKAAKAAESKE